MIPRNSFIAAALLFFAAAAAVPAQSTAGSSAASSTKSFDMSGFPVFAKDMRRAEIVAFGSFPFTIFAATFFMDLGRYIEHDRDVRYAPWPAKQAGAINMSSEDYGKTFLYAAIASLSIAAIDFSVVQIKRAVDKRRAEREAPASRVEIQREHSE